MISYLRLQVESMFDCREGEPIAFTKHKGKKHTYATLGCIGKDMEVMEAWMKKEFAKLRVTYKGKGNPILYWRLKPTWERERGTDRLKIRCRFVCPEADMNVLDAKKELGPYPRALTGAQLRTSQIPRKLTEDELNILRSNLSEALDLLGEIDARSRS